MKKSFKLGALILALVAGTASIPANAHPYHRHHDGFLLTALTLPTLWFSLLTDLAHHGYYKELFVAAQGDALDYLATGTVTEMFLEAKESIESQTSTSFDNNDHAAQAIYLLAEEIKGN